MAKAKPTPTDNTHRTRAGKVEPRLPHERDQSADSQGDAAAGNPPLGRQAHDDLARGLVDTDRGPVVDKLYNDKVAPRVVRRRAP